MNYELSIINYYSYLCAQITNKKEKVMKRSVHWIVAAILISGAIVMTSCSDDESSVIQASVSTEQPSALGDALSKISDDMGKISFRELTPLASSLNQGGASFSSNEIGSPACAALGEALKGLLEGLCGQSWQLGDLMNTLQSALNMSLMFEHLADNKLFGNNNCSGAFDIVLSDTLVYTVSIEKKRTVETTATSLSGNIMRKLVISKNGSEILTVDTTQDNAAGASDNTFGFTAAKTAVLCYGDAKFSYERQRQGFNSVVTSLSYFSGEAPIVSIKTVGDNNLSWESIIGNEVVSKGRLEISLLSGLVGVVSDVSDLGRFYASGLALGGLSIFGTTKDICQRHTDQLNSIVGSRVTMFSLDCGAITFEPILRHSDSNTYVPALMLTGAKGEKVPLKEALDALGITFESLMQMLVGR